jgi:kinetochore protein Mis12/MTW1
MTHGRQAGTTLTEDEASDLVSRFRHQYGFLLPTERIRVYLQEQGPHRLETLLESHMDSACDKFTAWALRNTFNIPDDLRLVLVSLAAVISISLPVLRFTGISHNQPWHKGLDFDRANFVASSAEGEDGIQNKIDELRAQVVEVCSTVRFIRYTFADCLSFLHYQMRKLKHQLDLANRKLDKQVKGLDLEKQAAGFVLDMAEEAGCESEWTER